MSLASDPPPAHLLLVILLSLSPLSSHPAVIGPLERHSRMLGSRKDA